MLPGFTQGPLGTSNDLAIIRLKSPIPSTYKPIQFDASGVAPPSLTEMGVILGYGYSGSDSETESQYRLRKIQLPMTRWDKKNKFDSEKFWVSAKSGSIASGDSGGPILFKRNGKFILYGIAIHNRYDDCVKERLCEPQSAFTNLSYFKDWLEQVVDNHKK